MDNRIIIAVNPLIDTFCGLLITPEEGETAREVLERSVTFAEPDQYPVINLEIIAPCGNTVTYKTLDDIPDHDVPCLCGNPDHWFIKIKRKSA